MHSLLIVDDDDRVLKSLARLLRSEDYVITCYRDPQEALLQCSVRQFDLVLSDQRMPGMEGTTLFARLARQAPESRRILISGYSDFSSVTDAFNAGVIHKFVLKPWDNEQLKALVAEQLALKDAGAKITVQPDPLQPESASRLDADAESFHGIVSSNPAMLQQLAVIRRTASSDAPFFILGETGTGKELIARAIHRESGRAEQPFIPLNCANLSESLLESQLFGHRKGAFTGADKDQTGLLAAAEGGTLFLDEVTELPLTLQAKLLRVLQEREFTPVGDTRPVPFDVKLLSASSTSLEAAVERGRFREDLRYRLEVIPLVLPPLRTRSEDRRQLFHYFLAKQMQRHQRAMRPVDPEVLACVDSYSWPGNVREMINVCTYIAALAGEEERPITVDQLPPVLRRHEIDRGAGQRDGKHGDSGASAAGAASATLTARQLTREQLEQALQQYGGHREAVARHFGISRMTLWRKMKQLGLG